MQKPTLGIIIAIVYDVLDFQSFDDRRTLIEAIERRCAKLDILKGHDLEIIESALARVEHAGKRPGEIPADAPALPPSAVYVRASDAPIVLDPPRAVATDLLRRLVKKTNTTGLKTMPYAPPPPKTHGELFKADKWRALQMLAPELIEATARSEALESTIAAETPEEREKRAAWLARLDAIDAETERKRKLKGAAV